MTGRDGMSINFDTIPDEFKNLKRFALWVKVKRGDKENKIPRNPRYTRYDCSFKDENALETFEYCRKFIEKNQEYGLAFSLPAGYTLIDCDDVITDQGISDELDHDIDRFHTYTEVSQSGTGIHVIGRGQPPGPIGGYDEVYSDGHWCYLTGDILQDCTNQVNDITGVLAELCEERKERISTRHKEAKDWVRTKTPGTPKNFDRRITDEYRLDVGDIGMPVNPVEVAPGIYQGENPFHGSTCGFNYRVDTRNNLWKCFRNYKSSGIEHGGGSGLEAFAVSEGIISCEDAKPGWFDDKEIQKKVFKALEDRGYKKVLPKPAKPKNTQEPVKVTGAEHPRFSLILEPGNWIKEFYDFHTRNNKAPYPEYFHACAIAIMSFATGRKVRINIAGDWLYPDLWSILLGASTISHKTDAINIATEWIRVSFPSNELSSNWSAAGLFEDLESHPQGYMVNDECASILNMVNNNKETASARDLLCNVYDCKQNILKRLSSRVSGRKSEYNIKFPFVVLLWATTPQSFSAHSTSLDVCSGWLLRFLYYYPNYKKEPVLINFGNGEKSESEKGLIEQFKRIRTTIESQAMITADLSDNVAEIFNTWHIKRETEIMESDNQVEQTLFGRLEMIAIKLAILYEICSPEWSTQQGNFIGEVHVSAEHMQEAIREVDEYFLPHARAVIAMIERDTTRNIQDKMLHELQGHGEVMKERDLKRKLHITADEYSKHISALVESEEVEQYTENNTQMVRLLV